jgi:hypothetical protein
MRKVLSGKIAQFKNGMSRDLLEEYSNTTIKKSIKEISIPLSHIDPGKWLVISIQLPLRPPCAIPVVAFNVGNSTVGSV